MNHPLAPLVVQVVALVPAFLLQRAVGFEIMIVALVPGLLWVWHACRWATNRDGAWNAVMQSEREHPRVWTFLTGSWGRRAPDGRDDPNARIPPALVVGAWGLLLTGVGIGALVAALT